ncbi:glycosyltransferase family 4 protein [Synechococcus sp. CCY 9618]|uniref:glycosyltransferase family 4 protein n=1 Tax=Synechococcus sp. CCY 9618 TaxID=2815602 RepID=UPI001C22567C|nr:glycosyltransferase family 4 protein [Synechococcus sp. CCY 9618]
MRVAFAHYSQANDISGVTTWVLTLARRLAADGVPVAIHFVIAPGEPQGEPSLFQDLRQRGIHVSSAPRRPTLKDDTRETLAFLNHWQPTVFLPQCKPAHYAAAAVAGACGLPWALTIHSDDPDYWSTVRQFGGSRDGSAIVSVSEHIQGELNRRAPDRASRVIPYGVAIPECTTTYRNDPFQVVFSGRLWEHQKRASLVIQALIGACQDHGAMRATLLGEGYARRDCERQVAEAGLTARITFTGSLPPFEVMARLLESQAILLMSDFEGLPIALLEAMAAGVVPVVRRIPSGIPELVTHEHTGLLVSEDPGEAAAALVRLAGDADLWRRCSTAARERVARGNSADTSYAQWREVLEQLDRQQAAAPSSPFPLDTRRIPSLRQIDPAMHQEYRRAVPLRAAFTQALRTGIARSKHRLKRLLPPHP